ncbi:glycosyltransferase [Brevibacillus sp. B_LB10_24]|uniref:glycosyltransferase n=1 Tax=Brevibacillus sp. B_LB10_24 TaxID=3380645 RepID=UPI0038BCC452
MKGNEISLLWEGSLADHHSLAKVNRNICNHLIAHKHIRLYRTDTDNKSNSVDRAGQADVSVRHQWPLVLDWTDGGAKYAICMQPWEFGAIPKQWYIPMKYRTDQIWVYSTYNKECYIRCGLPADKIKVIPLGVDESIYHYRAAPLKLEDTHTFRFLFVGGTIARKGIDTLLRAYVSEFRADEDVCLVIKDFGNRSFYQGRTFDKQIVQAASDPNHPSILYLDNYLSEHDLAGLYKACDCLVHPYRGEGFGLPIVEAMACGTPAILPDLGPSQDICDADTAFLLPSKEVLIEELFASSLDVVNTPWWLNVEQAELQKMMRFVYQNRDEVKKRGEKASQKILSNFTWRQTAQLIADSVTELAKGERYPRKSETEIIQSELLAASQLYQENKFDAAISLLQTILASFPHSFETRYNIALAYIRLNNFPAAVEHLNHATRFMTKAPEAIQAEIWNRIGDCYTQMHAFDQAIKAFQKSTALHPAYLSREILSLKDGVDALWKQAATLYEEMANCYQSLGSDFRAIEMYNKALRIGADQSRVQAALERVRRRIENTKRGIGLIRKKTALSPASPAADHQVIWHQTALSSSYVSAANIKESRCRWTAYFAGGNDVLEIEYSEMRDGQIDLETAQTYDGVLLTIRHGTVSSSKLTGFLTQCQSIVHHSGKIIIVAENPTRDFDLLSLKECLETSSQTAGWLIRESNELEDGKSVYLVLQKSTYDVLWQCPYFNLTGFSEEQKFFLDGIRPYPVRVAVHPVDSTETKELPPSKMKPYLSSLLKRRFETPLIHYQALPAVNCLFPHAPISILRTMFETDSLPAECIPIMNEMTEIWVPSEFNRQTFAQAGVSLDRIQIVPGTLDEHIFNPVQAQPHPLPMVRSFYFLSVFDWSMRKGWDILLRAYLEEFTEDDDVSLILKVSRVNEPSTNPQSIITDMLQKLGVRKPPHIHMIIKKMSDEELAGLYAAADCFVLPSRGEGWGRPYMEAMAMELPAIGTRWSGQLEFMNDDNSYLIELEGLVPIDAAASGMPPHFHGHRWAEPSADHLKSLMRHVYSHQSEAREKGRRARSELFPRFSRHTIGRQIFGQIDRLVKSHYR